MGFSLAEMQAWDKQGRKKSGGEKLSAILAAVAGGAQKNQELVQTRQAHDLKMREGGYTPSEQSGLLGMLSGGQEYDYTGKQQSMSPTEITTYASTIDQQYDGRIERAKGKEKERLIAEKQQRMMQLLEQYRAQFSNIKIDPMSPTPPQEPSMWGRAGGAIGGLGGLLGNIMGQGGGQQKITLPTTVKTTSQAKKHLMEQEGMSDIDAVNWIKKNL